MVSEDSVAVEELGYEPFGKRRFSDGTPDPNDTVEGVETDRGYTGHEHLDDFGLIHMNGRIYDPRIGRFLSAAPVIQSPQALQTYNRYSYAINNPLAYTDPSGYIFGIGGSIKDELKRWEQDFRHEIRRPNSLLPSLLRVGIAVGSAAGCNAWAAACAGAGEALLSGWQGADTGTAVRNGIVTAAAVYMYGEAGKYDLGTTETFFVYGSIGGVSSAATGQDIGSGFLAGGLSALVPTGSNFEVNLIVKATAGGTISELMGGKFANGAVTAAFAYTLSRAGGPRSTQGGEVTVDYNQVGSQADVLFVQHAFASLVGDPYVNQASLALAFVDVSLAAPTGTSFTQSDVAKGVLNTRFIQGQQAVATYSATVLGGAAFIYAPGATLTAYSYYSDGMLIYGLATEGLTQGNVAGLSTLAYSTVMNRAAGNGVAIRIVNAAKSEVINRCVQNGCR